MIRAVALTGVLAFAAGTADAAELRGQVSFLERGGARPARNVDPSEARLWFEPDRGARPNAARTFEMITRKKQFVPSVMAVPLGSTVRFPNADPILHNVFSVSRGNRFDLGFYRRGEGKSWTFDAPGVVRVFCNVHHSMVGYVVVLETPYEGTLEAGNRFVLSGLPAGPGKLTIWHPRVGHWTARVDPAAGGLPMAELEISRPRVPAHKNKHGKRYSRRSRDRYR